MSDIRDLEPHTNTYKADHLLIAMYDTQLEHLRCRSLDCQEVWTPNSELGK